MAAGTVTAIDLGAGDSNRRVVGPTLEEAWNLVKADFVSGDTFAITTKMRSVTAIPALPIDWSWAQTGATVTITGVGDSAAVDMDILLVGKPI